MEISQFLWKKLFCVPIFSAINLTDAPISAYILKIILYALNSAIFNLFEYLWCPLSSELSLSFCGVLLQVKNVIYSRRVVSILYIITVLDISIDFVRGHSALPAARRAKVDERKHILKFGRKFWKN